VVDRRDGRELHLRGVRKVPVAGINKVRGAATHEAQLHAQQIGAIVQIGMMHARFSLLLVRLQRLLAEDVVPCQRERNHSADGNDDSAFQIFPVFRARRALAGVFVERLLMDASVRAWKARSRYAIRRPDAQLEPHGDRAPGRSSARPAFREPGRSGGPDLSPPPIAPARPNIR
jgi:hypothetical protein